MIVDLWLPGLCSSLTKEVCLSAKKEGISCVLVDERECSTQDAAEKRLAYKNIEKITPTVCEAPPQGICLHLLISLHL